MVMLFVMFSSIMFICNSVLILCSTDLILEPTFLAGSICFHFFHICWNSLVNRCHFIVMVFFLMPHTSTAFDLILDLYIVVKVFLLLDETIRMLKDLLKLIFIVILSCLTL